MAAQHPRRQQEPGGHLVFAKAEQRRIRALPRRDDDCRREHRVAAGVAPRVRGRPWLPLQVEHGLDERYAQLHEHRSAVPRGQSQQSDVQLLLCVQRKFCSAHQPRRGGARQVQPHQ